MAVNNSNTNLANTRDIFTTDDKKWMDIAMEYAEEALTLSGRQKEVPVGCIFVQNNRIIARGRNEVNMTRNATRHAELVCLAQCTAQGCLSECTVYVTVEPCIMCAAALYNARVHRIVYACKNDRFGGATVVDVAAVLQSHLPAPATILQSSNYRAEDAMNLLQTFYRGQNPNTTPQI